MENEWESTKGPGNIWNPTKDAEGDPRTEADDDDYLDGYYIDKKENVGQHSANVYTIENKGGERFSVWGTTALNQEMDKIRMNQYIRIKWLGKLLTKKGAEKKEKQRVSTDSFHAWEVFVNKNMAPYSGSSSSSNDGFSKPAETKKESVKAVSASVPKDEDEDLPFSVG